MPPSITGTSKLIESQYFPGNRGSVQGPISSRILQKHLTENQHPIFQFIQANFDKLVNYLKPFYAITTQRIVKNVKGVIFSQWQFDLPEEEIQYNMQKQQDFIRMSHYLVPANPKPTSRPSISMQSSIRKSTLQQSDMYKKRFNRSIFMFLWGPITLMILTHLLSNHPFTPSQKSPSQKTSSEPSYINVIAGGIIHLTSMTIISFVMFVLFKVLKASGVHSWFQHITLSSFVGVASILFSLICSSGIDWVIIPAALVYILGCSYLHVNAYNQALKPQLFQLVGLAVLIMFFYTSTGFMFYHYYRVPEQKVIKETKEKHYFSSRVHQKHLINFEETYFKM